MNIKKLESNVKLYNESLLSNEMIDETLHIIMVISNICEYKRRWKLANEFIERMKKYNNMKLYIVELVYGDQEYKVTEEGNKNHLRLRTKHALWHKENLINLGIKNLLPVDWKAVAWIDADIEFMSDDWIKNTLKLLRKFDVVQLFRKCEYLDENEKITNVLTSYGYKYYNGEKYKYSPVDKLYWHPGFCWSCTSCYYNKMNGLYENGIIGGGDSIMSIGYLFENYNKRELNLNFRIDINNYIKKNGTNVKVCCIPTNIKHYFHGQKKNRKYSNRNEILKKYNYNPSIHITKDENGILIPTEKMSNEFLEEILNYFKERNEDEFF